MRHFPRCAQNGALVATAAAIALGMAINNEPQVRLAYSNDGNLHDHDDIGAAAMMQALMWRAGVRHRLVYVEHSSHVGASSTSQHTAMIESATGHASEFGVSLGRVHDQFADPGASAVALAAEIEASSVGRPLVFFQSGPWESMARGFDLADPASHQFVKIISHSDWNDGHKHQSSHRGKAEFFARYAPGGPLAGFTAPDYERIDDQNGYAFRSNLSAWGWLDNDPDLSFVLDRTIAAGSAQGDMSDAGMVFYYFTGIEHPTMTDIRDFLE